MYRVDLNAVHSGVLEHFCAFCKRVHEFVYLVNGHGARRHLVRPAVGGGAGVSRDLIKIHKRLADGAQEFVRVELFHHLADGEGASEAGGELDEQLGTGLVEFRHPLCQVVIHFFVFVEPLTEHRVVDGLTSGHDKACVVFGDFHNEARTVAVKMVFFHPSEKICAAHACKHYAVFDLAFADLPRREKGI